ncbi:hypothetical protein GALMADRAFT_257184 [Galerina marginata CBS 339.88]|uniref:Uncharacterized protein n=1 Tax=Galerina marginata (strain CBS 339.88) TaxID=685588 RepID=A0A067SER4_GALM3|nr:hypothetical protein GALMADRAFT_257184 [Galerina marginata CBS 339.88]
MPEISALGPIDPASVPEVQEEEKAAPWIVRKLVGSMTGRIVMSSYETLRAAGTNVVCLSPWGDSSPLFLPCIRFRDLAVHTVIAATGGMAAVAAPVMGPVSDVVVGSFGDTILVELGLHAGFDLTVKAADDLVFDHTIKKLVPIHSQRLETTGVKVLLITLRYKHTMSDAALGFYRSSMHSDTSLFAAVKDYLAVEKGWFSPYLFASARRPIIPRNMKPDIIFCHGPFLSGDYRVGEALLNESASVIALCDAPPPEVVTAPVDDHLSLKNLSMPSLSSVFSRSRTASPEPALTPLPPPPTPRRMIILLVGLKPHRKLWTLSARPSESVINYILLNGCPVIVVPVKVGAPLLAWDGLTLEQLWEIDLPPSDETRSTSGKFEGIVDVIFEYVDLCVDWDRIKIPVAESNVASSAESSAPEKAEKSEVPSRELLKDAITLLVAAAIRSKTSKAAKKELDADRSGIAMWRIP